MIFVVPPTHIDQAWKDGAEKLSQACKRVDEVTADQLKMLLSRGEKQLVGIDGGWAVIQFEQLPNKRVLFVYSLYAPGRTQEFFELLSEVAKQNGCSAIRGACDDANKRLWEMKLGAKTVYSILEYEL